MGSGSSTPRRLTRASSKAQIAMPPQLRFVARVDETEELAASLNFNKTPSGAASPRLCILCQPRGTGKKRFAMEFLGRSGISIPKSFRYTSIDLRELPAHCNPSANPDAFVAAVGSMLRAALRKITPVEVPPPQQQLQPQQQPQQTTEPPTPSPKPGMPLGVLTRWLERNPTVDVFLHVEGVEALCNQRSQIRESLAVPPGTASEALRPSNEAARKCLALFELFVPCLPVPRVHVLFSSDSFAPLVLRRNFLGVPACPATIHHIVLDPLWPADIRQACAETAMENGNGASVLEALGMDFASCQTVFEYTGGLPLAVEQTLGLLWLLRNGVYPGVSRPACEIRNIGGMALRELMDTVIAAELVTNDQFIFHRAAFPPVPPELLPAFSHYVVLPTLDSPIDLSETATIGDELVPLVYWADDLRLFLARGPSQDVCEAVWPIPVARELLGKAAGPAEKLPFWNTLRHDPAYSLEYPILRMLGQLDCSPPYPRPNFGNVAFFLRGTALEEVPFIREGPLIDLFEPGTPLHEAVSSANPVALRDERATAARKSRRSLSLRMPCAAVTTWPVVRMYVATKGDDSDAASQVYSSWVCRNDKVTGLARIKTEIDVFATVLKTVAVERRRIRGVLVIISPLISDRLRTLAGTAGALYIGPGSHGLSKKSGKLQPLSKKNVEMLRAKHQRQMSEMSPEGSAPPPKAEIITVPPSMEVVVLGREGMERLIGVEPVATIMSLVNGVPGRLDLLINGKKEGISRANRLSLPAAMSPLSSSPESSPLPMPDEVPERIKPLPAVRRNTKSPSEFRKYSVVRSTADTSTSQRKAIGFIIGGPTMLLSECRHQVAQQLQALARPDDDENGFAFLRADGTAVKEEEESVTILQLIATTPVTDSAAPIPIVNIRTKGQDNGSKGSFDQPTHQPEQQPSIEVHPPSPQQSPQLSH